MGGTGIVIQQGQSALKIPQISRPIQVDTVPVATGRLTPEEGTTMSALTLSAPLKMKRPSTAEWGTILAL
ncbi:hypothetical protein BJX99DRAFT_220285 [Aspergillus californicus]